MSIVNYCIDKLIVDMYTIVSQCYNRISERTNKVQGLVSMPLRCDLNVLLARENLKRAQVGEKPLTWFHVAKETGLTHSALLKLARGESKRVDFDTIDLLMVFFKTEDVNDILRRVAGDE